MRVITFAGMLLLSSCASIYTGRDLPEVSTTALSYSDATVTFRFVSISKMDHQDQYYVSRSSYKGKAAFQFIENLKSFKKVELSELPYESLSVKKGDDLNALLKKSIPNFETDYFVEVITMSPFMPHGGGLGMWGGLISTISLGIIPAWWHFDENIEVKVYKGDVELRNFNLTENYHTFSSTLFHLIPSSERSLRNPLNKVEKNILINVLQKVKENLKD